MEVKSLVDPTGYQGCALLPRSPFFIFIQVLGEIGQSNRLVSPPLWLGPPSSGKYWIRHCLKVEAKFFATILDTADLGTEKYEANGMFLPRQLRHSINTK